MTKALRVELNDRSYPIYIGPGLLQQQELFVRHIRSKQVLVLTNETIAPLYLSAIKNACSAFALEEVIIPDGEQYKSMASLNGIFDHLLAQRFSRNSTLIALGGGVIGDLGGFAAACYQRGIHFVQIPTTLLAQVDSSVGGKTAVNHPLGKNMIGAFYQPSCVIADTQLLQTLPDRELSAGLAEVIKYGLIRDKPFFEWLEQNTHLLLQRNDEALSAAIERSCLNKAQVVAEDEREGGVRATLNLGHTFGHAIETGMGYGQYLHGEAVAIGIGFAVDLSRRLGLLTVAECERIIKLLQAANLPVAPPDMTVDRYLELMSVDKKNIDGEIRVILLESIGQAKLPLTVENEILTETLRNYDGSFASLR